MIAKHTEEIAALNNRAEQTNEKNLDACTELTNKYIESFAVGEGLVSHFALEV